jgi:hypothetical protein
VVVWSGVEWSGVEWCDSYHPLIIIVCLIVHGLAWQL